MKNGDQPAFPQSYEKDSARLEMVKKGAKPSGLTKREYFAAMAMQGLVSREGWAERFNDEVGDNSLLKTLAGASVKMADELLKQLEIQ